ncbi:MAG: hypothetical protein IJP64_08275 [Oscillospiraceae bacterium]|nr:hypothetical protein [Oscillospiraceae bacterium]
MNGTGTSGGRKKVSPAAYVLLGVVCAIIRVINDANIKKDLLRLFIDMELPVSEEQLSARIAIISVVLLVLAVGLIVGMVFFGRGRASEPAAKHGIPAVRQSAGDGRSDEDAKRIAQLDEWLKSGLIDQEEYRAQLERLKSEK